MSDIAIRVANLSKRYKIGALRNRHDTLRDHLSGWTKSLFVRNGHSSAVGGSRSFVVGGSDTIWALKNVFLEIKHGEVVGFIGGNGAGKSTLLKILSRITAPTIGSAEIFGRIGSLLEVGTGFHPELTGRENIYFNGAILGMKKWEIDNKFDEIVAFSEIEKFIDTPVKRYSSGMYVRLAFAVAAHLDPEILVVDEVLAVGDTPFQQKCLGKMQAAATSGRTVLFVSHNLAAVEHLCHKGVALQDGKLVFSGTAKEAVNYYLHGVDGGRRNSGSHVVDLSNAAGRPSRFLPLLQRMEVFTDGDKPVTGSLRLGASLKVHLYFRPENLTSTFEATLAFDNILGQRIFTAEGEFRLNPLQGKGEGDRMLVCEIPSLTLLPGEYKIKLSLDIYSSPVDIVEDATRITIVGSDYYGTGKVPQNGMFVLKHNWHLT